MRILLCCGNNLNEEHLLSQPVAEMQKHIVRNIISREDVDDIVVSAIKISHGFANISRVIWLVIENSIHAI